MRPCGSGGVVASFAPIAVPNIFIGRIGVRYERYTSKRKIAEILSFDLNQSESGSTQLRDLDQVACRYAIGEGMDRLRWRPWPRYSPNSFGRGRGHGGSGKRL